MAEFPAFPLWTDAYLADTTHLDATEHGAYLMLLISMWRAGGSLPNDAAKLCRFAHAKTSQWSKIWATIGSFFAVEGTQIVQGRLVDELEKARGRSQKAAQSARAKYRKTNKSAPANAEPEHSSASASTSTSTSTSRSKKELPSPSIKEPQLGLVDIAAQPSTDEPVSTARGKRIPPDWKLSRPLGQWALEKWPNLTADQVREEAEAFKDYWIAASGQRASKREWSAAFREWMRRSDAVKAPRARASKYSGFEEAKRKVQQELADAGYSGQEGDHHGDDGGLPLLTGPSRQRHR